MTAPPVPPVGTGRSGRPYPTRSPYRIEDDEGPQTIAALRAALAPWPDELRAFTARLEAVPFDQIRDLISEYRAVWLARTHPVIQEAVRASEDGTAVTYSSAEVWADLDPDAGAGDAESSRDQGGTR
jgi:hypothetical protein